MLFTPRVIGFSLSQVPVPVPGALLATTLAVLLLSSAIAPPVYSEPADSPDAVPLLVSGRRLKTSALGGVPYQRWRLPSWGDQKRYVWIVGNHDFHKFDHAEIVLYFHGTHAKDYYQEFRGELTEAAQKNPYRPFLFVGFVDAPNAKSDGRGQKRWEGMVPKSGERPDRLLRSLNQVFSSFRRTFPHMRKSRTKLVLSGFSGGGKVLDSVGTWLARSAKDDPYARVFQLKLSKMLYFDCWFNPAVVETVPTLLAKNPSMKIVGTVHMQAPKKFAQALAGKLRMRGLKGKNEMIGLGGRMSIYREESHWKAMVACLSDALHK